MKKILLLLLLIFNLKTNSLSSLCCSKTYVDDSAEQWNQPVTPKQCEDHIRKIFDQHGSLGSGACFISHISGGIICGNPNHLLQKLNEFFAQHKQFETQCTTALQSILQQEKRMDFSPACITSPFLFRRVFGKNLQRIGTTFRTDERGNLILHKIAALKLYALLSILTKPEILQFYKDLGLNPIRHRNTSNQTPLQIAQRLEPPVFTKRRMTRMLQAADLFLQADERETNDAMETD